MTSSAPAESTVNGSSSPVLLPPNDASVISLLAAEAKLHPELETQLKHLAFNETQSQEELEPVKTLMHRFQQQLREQHGASMEQEIRDKAEEHTFASWHA